MAEQFAEIGDITLCYETFGNPEDPSLLLIMGLGTQMIGWREEFCEQLAGRGFHVIRFDNRDIGRSSRVRARPPTTWQLIRRSKDAAKYTLDDMAGDAEGLLDHLGIASAHVVGASMGGMIAQTLAVRQPHRVRSLVSIMSTTGGRWVGQPTARVLPILIGPRPTDRHGFVESAARTFRLIGSTQGEFEFDEEGLREVAGRQYDRGHDAAGSARQLAAIVASGDRTSMLRAIRVPTLVIHGTADRLVRPSGGRATAKAIPGARLMTIDGMGHDLPRKAWTRIIDAIAEQAQLADRAAAELSVR